jgi:hypothetical protein
MITGASHTLHTNLTDSLSYYRQLLDAQKLKQSSTPADGEVSQLPSPGQPTEPKSFVVEGELNQIPVSEQIKQAANERRDLARAAAVSVESMQQKQDVINTYMNAAGTTNETSSVSSDNAVSPSEVYQETLTYQRRQDLMSALQQAAGGDQLGKIVDITV